MSEIEANREVDVALELDEGLGELEELEERDLLGMEKTLED